MNGINGGTDEEKGGEVEGRFTRVDRVWSIDWVSGGSGGGIRG